MTHRGSRVLHVGALTRVEGEGALHLTVNDGAVTDARLQIYEPPRFFEGFLRGRSYTEPPDITARICGICPVAYQMSSARALENACGVEVDGQLGALRRLLYCGEWIESHALHIYLLHAPDFAGVDSAIDLARTHRADVERGLRMKKVGNDILEVIGGRAIHPINIHLGGFHHVPSRSEIKALAEPLRRARDDAWDTCRLVASFDFPEAMVDTEFLCLSEPGTYAIDRGIPTAMAAPSASGLPPYSNQALPTRSFPLNEWEQHVVEEHKAHSNALHSKLDGKMHLTGPLARYAINGRWLSPIALQAAAETGLGDPREGKVERNQFRSIIVRAVELLYAIDEALRLVEAYEPPSVPFLDAQPRAGSGYGATEAPRGTLYHRYTITDDGSIESCTIVPPTAQNQGAVEADLRNVVQAALAAGDPTDAELTHLCEHAIRNYDPCISCATHFLDLTIERS